MAIARVDQGSGVYWLSAIQLASGPVYVERALTVNVTAGSTLVAVHFCGANDPATFSGGGATWVAPASASIWHSAIAQYVQIGYGYNATGGATTVRATGTVNTQNRQILVMELTGMPTTDPVTGTPTEAQASSSSVPLPGSITSDGDAIFIAAGQFHPTTEPTPATGYTSRYYADAAGGFYSRGIVDQIITGATTSNPGWSTNKDYFVAAGIALKAAAGGASAVPAIASFYQMLRSA